MYFRRVTSRTRFAKFSYNCTRRKTNNLDMYFVFGCTIWKKIIKFNKNFGIEPGR